MIATKVVISPKSVVISASLGVTKMTTLNVRLPGVSSLTLIPTELTGGDNAIGIVTLEAASAAPVLVTITSSKPDAMPDTTLVIPAGATSGTFSIGTNVVGSTVMALITAKANNIAKTQALIIDP